MCAFVNLSKSFFFFFQGARTEHYNDPDLGPKAFIHADNFDSAKSLADYLLYLDRNRTAYSEYFNWKRRIVRKFEKMVENPNPDETILEVPYAEEIAPFCELCAKLHNDTYLNDVTKPTLKITDFFNPERDCRDNRDPNKLKNFFKNIIGKCV